jgi:hypothetical protein
MTGAMSTGEQIARVIGALPAPLWSAPALYVIWRLRGSLSGAVARLSGFEGWARMLRSFGCLTTFAATTGKAMRALKQGQERARPFRLILSDISRQLPTQDPTAGLSMPGDMRANGIAQPLIFYIGQPKPGATIPAGAFGITHRPDQQLKLVVDAMVRVRGE